MQLGMIGLGRMGANIVRRLMRDGHTCVVYDVSPDAVETLAADGATGASTLEDFVAKLDVPRRAWRSPRRRSARSVPSSARATRSSTAETPTTGTTSAALPSSASGESTTW